MKQTANLLQDLMLLNRAAQLILQERVIETTAATELNPAKLNVLRLLSRRKEQSVNDIARFLEYTKAAASQNVERLVQGGLARRRTDEDDRRCTWISLTPKGRRLLEKLERRQEEALRDAVSGLPKNFQKTLALGMRRLAFSLLQGSGAEPSSCLQCCAYNSAGCLHDEEGNWACRYALVASGEDDEAAELLASGGKGKASRRRSPSKKSARGPGATKKRTARRKARR